MKVATDDNRFIAMSCVNIVIAANAGGAFSPFGDITTFMVWQADVVAFSEFFVLFLPALVSYIIPALVMSFFINNKHPQTADEDVNQNGAIRILCLFLLPFLRLRYLKQRLVYPCCRYDDGAWLLTILWLFLTCNPTVFTGKKTCYGRA